MLVQHDVPLAAEIDALGGIPWLEVTVPGEPVGKARARAGNGGHHFTPTKTRNAEAWVRHCIVQQVGHPLLEVAVQLDIVAVRTVPASWSQRRRRDALQGFVVPVSKPDFDNVTKLLCDAANGVLWRDDCLIADVRVRKLYGERPFSLIRCRPLAPGVIVSSKTMEATA